MKEFFHLQGTPRVEISDRDVKFTSTFWKALFLGSGTQIQFSAAYHPQMDEQIEWVNKVLEDMLRMFVMQQPHQWEDYIHLVEFAHNNGHHESLGMSPFEVEPEGEFLAKPLHILDWREITLRRQAITQVKVKWKHVGPNEATWEEEGFMWEAYPALFP
eukprot:PITA_30090